MASTPSTSALSAVLRCRGKLWARNPQTKRPQAAYGLRVPGAVLREAPTTPWESFRRGERVLVAGGLELEYRTRTDSHCGPRVRESPEREPLLRLSPALSGPTPGLHWGHRTGPGSAAGVLKLTVRSKSWSWFSVQDAGRSQWTVRGGWSGLRGSLLSLTALVSSILSVSPALGSGPGRPEDGAPFSSIQNQAQQINTLTSFSDETSCRRITEDRPD
ncbi:uncharacterized protein LOC114478588 [Gouania willdenowi]|uniref:uncharacterized protein LOC114478588 n=1 Tax=Gouania willdenowi TaxID=441366 RepID=UPI001055B78A|nr:uncharacterized protein LOC114478588 [Gouania willdenowi]